MSAPGTGRYAELPGPADDARLAVAAATPAPGSYTGAPGPADDGRLAAVPGRAGGSGADGMVGVVLSPPVAGGTPANSASALRRTASAADDARPPRIRPGRGRRRSAAAVGSPALDAAPPPTPDPPAARGPGPEPGRATSTGDHVLLPPSAAAPAVGRLITGRAPAGSAVPTAVPALPGTLAATPVLPAGGGPAPAV